MGFCKVYESLTKGDGREAAISNPRRKPTTPVGRPKVIKRKPTDPTPAREQRTTAKRGAERRARRRRQPSPRRGTEREDTKGQQYPKEEGGHGRGRHKSRPPGGATPHGRAGQGAARALATAATQRQARKKRVPAFALWPSLKGRKKRTKGRKEAARI